MIFGMFTDFGAMNAGPVFQAFKQGAEKLGHTVVEGNWDMPDVAVIWSVLWNGRMKGNQKVMKKFTEAGKPVIVLEVGGLIRNKTWKVAVGGINGEAYFGHETDNTSDRLTGLKLKMQPWRPRTYQPKYVLVLGQNEFSHQWRDMPTSTEWIESIITQIRTVTDRDIRIRPHPRSPLDQTWIKETIKNYNDVYFNQPRQVAGTYDDFDFDKQLNDAWCVVNWSSNPATQAALNGVPIFTGPESLAAPVANLNLKRIEDPDMPDRQQWANNIAYTEWTIEEISQGIPLKRILHKLEEIIEENADKD
jgi:hypothetical protein